MSLEMKVMEGLPGGFLWAAVKAGIKASGKSDLAACLVDGVAQGAAVFTSNQVVAAPVTVGRNHMSATGGRVGLVLVNAGNANCATGQAGLDACNSTCTAAAETFGCIFDEVFPSSTGIIGVPFPADKVIAALPELKASLGNSAEHAKSFARAIMTTDTRMKVAQTSLHTDDGEIRIFGVAKGAGMIHPQLGAPVAPHATMLVYLFTDVEAESSQLRELIPLAVDKSFNSISIDGDTSTNDTVLLLASGASGVRLNDQNKAAFAAALNEVCQKLAYAIVDDGEGVTHVVTLHITGARNEYEARQIAKSIAHSPLCKTAWSSADPNWGRLMAAAGYSGVEFDPAKVKVRIGEQPVYENGMRSPDFDEARAHTVMQQRDYTIRMDMGQGDAECRFITCDLTAEYVRINADYST
ncbi:bifunctional glutamate N-acetyltransferase/amino-acid acetyltransferase ArgJ [Edaphobacter sp. 12200R-103]|uniref:bifunctional glutamate N-acetyltransferase/amino-acid acetyltransferase ArgJ n=1 Tax=Edaphobacter sp. 12200R-103 TaxID=2703788 RepID=UPI00138B70A7|nr:bifunctional glutamate N-acetyltransferase/amino-acid acetyltransferase ArgJ [Edaphobacter sp. 12200R-103]QHS51205.1 bifunctional glutamate N-acetyltransferase/amino-acid acetyltransferase ArgJ [Edaphobacter sp. 12200R-103]